MRKLCILLLLSISAVILNVNRVYAQDDENIDDIVDVEGEDNSIITDEEPEEETTTASSDADTTILFIKPVYNGLSTLELPAGNLVELLVGFANKGESDFVLESLDASFRYAMDFNFYIQNFSTVAYNKIVKPKHEATLAYSFIPSENLAGRPFGFNINLNYRDANGMSFSEAVYNETVQIIELDDGLDGETVFLYVFLAACVILTLVGGQQLLSSLGRKSRSSTTRKTPWVLFAFNLIISGGGMTELFGILVGHLYVFLKFKYPQELGGPEFLNTPKILESCFPPQRGGIRWFGTAPTQRTQEQPARNIFGNHNWGRGHVLGH